MKRNVVNGKALEDVVEPELHRSEVKQLRVQVREIWIHVRRRGYEMCIAATIRMFDKRCWSQEEKRGRPIGRGRNASMWGMFGEETICSRTLSRCGVCIE